MSGNIHVSHFPHGSCSLKKAIQMNLCRRYVLMSPIHSCGFSSSAELNLDLVSEIIPPASAGLRMLTKLVGRMETPMIHLGG